MKIVGFAKKEANRASSRADFAYPRKSAGFTLVEVIIAAMLMGLGIASAFVTLRVGLNNLDNARMTSLVGQVLQDEAERIRLLNWGAVRMLPSVSEVSLPPQFEETAVGGDRVSIERRVLPVSGFPDTREISLTASWTSVAGTFHSRKMILRYSRGGLYDYYYGTGDS